MKKQILLPIFLLLVCLFSANAQKITISGCVKDASDTSALIVVKIIELGKDNRAINSTLTDFNGMYSLELRQNCAHIKFCMMGYNAVDTFVAKSCIIDIFLTENKDKKLSSAVELRDLTPLKCKKITIPKFDSSISEILQNRMHCCFIKEDIKKSKRNERKNKAK